MDCWKKVSDHEKKNGDQKENLAASVLSVQAVITRAQLLKHYFSAFESAGAAFLPPAQHASLCFRHQMPIGCDATTILLPRTASSIDCHYPNAQPRLCILQEPPLPSSDLHIASAEGRCPNQRQQGRASTTDRPHVFHHIRDLDARKRAEAEASRSSSPSDSSSTSGTIFQYFSAKRFGLCVFAAAAAGLICSSLLLIIESRPPLPRAFKTHHYFFWFTVSVPVHQLWELLQKATECHTTPSSGSRQSAPLGLL